MSPKTRARVKWLFFAISLAASPPGFSSSETYTNRVTISVPSYLFIGSDQKDLNFTFSDYQPGSETETLAVTYKVAGNNLSQADGMSAVNIRLGGLVPNMDFKVRVEGYTREGGNTELRPISPEFVTVRDSEGALAAKANSTGDGKILKGQIAMTYKAVATSILSPGNYSSELTLTLTDI